MAVEVSQVLLGLLPTLGEEVPAQLPAESYAQGQLRMISALMFLAAVEHERGADTRIWENAEMRRIFAGAAEALADLPFRDELLEAASAEEADFKMSTLNAANGDLRKLLIELHSFVEEQGTSAAQRVDREIWSFLRGSADRRYLEIPALGEPIAHTFSSNRSSK